MKDLTPIRGRQYILDLIAQGEHQRQDFKYAISDARKIARTISAFANCEGGHLLVGVKDNGVIAGVRNEEDIYVIEQAAQIYCKPEQIVDFTAFSTGDSGIVIRAKVEKSEFKPVMAQEPDKSWRAYFRVADENIVAHPLMVRTWKRQAQHEYLDLSPDLIDFGSRRRCSDVRRGESMDIEGIETKILRAIPADGSLPISEAVKITGVTRRTTENAIVRLALMHLVDFVHTRSGFAIVLADPF